MHSGLPMTMPSEQVFNWHMNRLRLGLTCKLICYDQVGMFAVARAAWMLQYFGALDVRILNGGLNKWMAEGREVYSGHYSPGAGLCVDQDYDGWIEKYPDRIIKDINEVYQIVGEMELGSDQWQIIDARSKAKFDGLMPEAKGLRKGHITGSINVPYSELIDHGCLKSAEDLKEIF